MDALIGLTSSGIVATLVIFVIGLLVGAIVKKAFKLGVMIIALLIILAATGYFAFNLQPNATTISRVYSQLTPAATQAASFATVLPITSTAFLVGLAIGIWKG